MPDPIALKDLDYVLEEDAAWIEVKGFSIRIKAGDEGVSLVVYKAGAEDQPSITETWATYSELEEESVDG